jgi:hypothetical protein
MRSRRAALPLLLALGLAACSMRSEVAELEPGVFALTMHSATPAAAARLGVERARSFCAGRQAGFEPVRTEIGNADYRIAFRCPRPIGDLFAPDMPVAPALPQIPEAPGFRQEPGLL